LATSLVIAKDIIDVIKSLESDLQYYVNFIDKFVE